MTGYRNVSLILNFLKIFCIKFSKFVALGILSSHVLSLCSS